MPIKIYCFAHAPLKTIVDDNFNRFLCFLATCLIKHSINKSINDMIATLYVGKMSWKLMLDIDYHFVAMKKKIINHGPIPITASIYERGGHKDVYR